MGVIVIATIGARDLRFPLGDGKWCSLDTPHGNANDNLRLVAERVGCEPTLRAVSSAILARPELEKDLKFPILEPGLDFVLRNGPIDRLLMVSTDQPETEPLRVNDTADTAKVLGRLCKSRYGDVIGQVEASFVELSEPNDSATYERLRSALATLALPRSNDTIVLLPTGGMPKVKDYLRLAAFYLFGLGTRVVEVLPPKPDISGADMGRPVETREPFVLEAIRQAAIVQVNRSDYQGALATLQGFAPESWPADVLDALAKASARMNLDFAEGALGHYDDSPIWAVLGDRPDNDAFERVTEVYYQVELCLEQGRYADAIFRVTLFIEACAWQAALYGLGQDFDRYALDDRLPIPTLAVRHPRLSAQLKKEESDHGLQRPKGDKASWKVSNRRHRNVVFKYVGTLNTVPMETFQLPTSGPLHLIVDMRHAAIHFPTGVTCQRVAEACGVTAMSALALKSAVRTELFSLLEPKLAALGKLKGQTVRPNPYPVLNEALRQRLLTGSTGH